MISLLMVGVLSIGTLSIEAGRLQAAKTQISEATMSASTSMIADYDTDLYSRYGLLAIDTENFTPERANDYLTFNSDLAAGYSGNRLSTLYTVTSIELESMYNLTNPQILKRQILSRAKYHVIPSETAINVNNIDSFFSDFEIKCQSVISAMDTILAKLPDNMEGKKAADTLGAEMSDALGTMYNMLVKPSEDGGKLDFSKNNVLIDEKCNSILSSGNLSILPSKTGIVTSPALSEDLELIEAANQDVVSVLGTSFQSVTGDVYNSNDIAETDTDFADKLCLALLKPETVGDANYVNRVRDAATSVKNTVQTYMNALNILGSDKDGNVLLNSYISEYFSNRKYTVSSYNGPAKNTSSNSNFVSACAEYIISGNSSERVNQAYAYKFLLCIRLVANLDRYLKLDSYDTNDAWSICNHLTWAYYESLLDMRLMVDYSSSVPFNKFSTILNITDAAKTKTAFSSENLTDALKSLGLHDGTAFVVYGDNSFSYKDMISFGLWFIPNSDKMLRMADLIQLEMRYKEQYEDKKTPTFLMSEQDTYCRIKSTGKFNPVLPTISFSAGQSTNGINMQSLKYAGY